MMESLFAKFKSNTAMIPRNTGENCEQILSLHFLASTSDTLRKNTLKTFMRKKAFVEVGIVMGPAAYLCK